jgi:phosphoribosylaminoimidazole-succinocarboxamide synthase
VSGVRLPPGLRLASRLPEVVFTPATKATSGHDENIDFAQMAERVGAETAAVLRDLSVDLYRRGAAVAERCGLIVADTKFEFGRRGTTIHLVDEVLTPDSSRFWLKDSHAPGQSPPSFDKQFVRDWLETTSWDKSSPPPPLPAAVVAKTREKYLEALVRLTGRGLA